MKSGLFMAAAIALSMSFVGSPASAALTSSEKGQIKDFITAAKVENANQVRSLVARTDLTPEESSGVLIDAIAPLAWSEPKGQFLKEVVQGGAASTRPVLAIAATKALLARADNIFQHEGDKLEKNRAAVSELVALYAWLELNVATAGGSTPLQHSAANGLTAATYEECSKLMKEHIEKNPRFLKGFQDLPDATARIRAQAQVTLIDMMPDGLTRRVEAASRLGLNGPRKQMLTEWGVLFADAGKLDDTKVTKVRETLLRMPGARADLSLVFFGPEDHRQGLVARGEIAHVVGGLDKYPFDGDTPATWDPAVGTIVHDLANLAAQHGLKTSPNLATQVKTDAMAATADPNRVLGRPRAPSAEYVLGSAINCVMTDAQRSIDVSIQRFNGGQPQSAALLSDALAALAAYPDETGKATTNPKIEVGKAGAFLPVTVKKGASDTVASFSFDSHNWAIDRQGTTNAVVGVRKDGAAATTAAPKPPPSAPKK